MNFSSANLLHGNDRDDVAVPARTCSFYLTVQLDPQDVMQIGAEEFWLQSKSLNKILLLEIVNK